MSQNTNENVNHQSEKHYILLQPLNQFQEPQTIDLIDLFKIIFQSWRMILVITAVITILSAVLAFSLTPAYVAKTYLSKPSFKQIQALQQNTGMPKISGTFIFKKFVHVLSQEVNIIDYLQNTHQFMTAKYPSQAPKLEKINRMAKNFKVTLVRHDKNDTKDAFKDNNIDAIVETVFPILDLKARQNLNYIAFTNKKVLSALVQGQKAQVHAQIKEIEEQMKQNVAVVRKKRLNQAQILLNEQNVTIKNINNKIIALQHSDQRGREIRLKELENALQLAKTLGIKSYRDSDEVKKKGVFINLRSNDTQLFLYGTTYLQKEIALLKAHPHSLDYLKKLSALQEALYLAQNDAKILELQTRGNDDVYVQHNAELLAKLTKLKSLSFDVSGVQLYSQLAQPYISNSSKGPNKVLIIILGSLVGFLVSVCFILLRRSITNHNQTEERPSLIGGATLVPKKIQVTSKAM